MPAAVASSVKCRPHYRLSPPQPPAALELLPRAPAAACELRATRCRSPPSLSYAHAADRAEAPRGPCRSPPSMRRARASDQGDASQAPCGSPTSTRRARPAVAGEEVGLPASAAVMLAGAQSRHAIFRDELVRKAFYAAEAAHRGQVFDRVPHSIVCSSVHFGGLLK
jgi:hypothetical protein